MNSLRKRTFCAAVAAVTALCACSCGYKETRTPINRPQEVSFSWWGNDIRSNYTMAAIDEYEARDPQIDVIPYSGDFTGYKENLEALMSRGKESDVIQINYSWLSELSADGEGFYDLNELSGYIALDNFTAEQLSYGTIDGKLNAIPISLNAVTFYYNKDIFENHGLDIPTTWDDLFACAEVLSADGIYTLETADIYCWLMLIAHEEQISGRAAFNEDGSLGFDEQNFISMMNFYQSLIANEVMPAYGELYSKEHYENGQTAAQLLWVSDAQYYVVPLDESGNGHTVVSEYLTTSGALRSGWYIKPTSLYAISKNTRDPQQTAKLLDFLLNDPEMARLQGTEKGIPLSKSALETLSADDMLSGVPYEASRMISDTNTQFNLMPNALENGEIYAEFFRQFGLYFYGQVTAEQAAAELVAFINSN